MDGKRYLYFYDHYNDTKYTNITCLSNFHPSFISDNKIIFFNVEQHFMYSKALFFHDVKTANEILSTRSPYRIRELGKKVKNFNYKTWESNKYKIMYKSIRLKFKQNPRMERFLLSTNNLILVNVDPVDTVWGIGMSLTDLMGVKEDQWKGENLLGKVLMNLRKHLKQEYDERIERKMNKHMHQ